MHFSYWSLIFVLDFVILQAGTQFKTSLNNLMTILMCKQPSYVRCIKPNDSKKAGQDSWSIHFFSSQKTSLQVRALTLESKLEGQGGTMHVFLFTLRSRVGLNISLLVYLEFQSCYLNLIVKRYCSLLVATPYPPTHRQVLLI